MPNLIHDHIVDCVQRNVCDDDLKYRYLNQRNLFVYKDSVILFIKKLDANLQSQNYPTPAALNFSSQEELEGIPVSLPRVEMGYVADAVGSSVNGIFAVYKTGKKVDWSIDLNDDYEPRQQDIKFG